MKIEDITTVLEDFAPLTTQEGYDNAGLITGCREAETTGALVCVDVTDEVLDEAIQQGANLVIAHHPLIFRPLKSLAGAGNVERLVREAVRNDIAIYACHTNLDRAEGGMSHVLAAQLGLKNIETLDPLTGFGAVGELDSELGTEEFLTMVKSTLNIGCIRHSEPPKDSVKRIAVITGAGGEGLETAIERGADALLTADLRHDRFLAARGRILLADTGHHESESCAIPLIIGVILKKFPTFAVRPCANPFNPVKYYF